MGRVNNSRIAHILKKKYPSIFNELKELSLQLDSDFEQPILTDLSLITDIFIKFHKITNNDFMNYRNEHSMIIRHHFVLLIHRLYNPSIFNELNKKSIGIMAELLKLGFKKESLFKYRSKSINYYKLDRVFKQQSDDYFNCMKSILLNENQLALF